MNARLLRVLTAAALMVVVAVGAAVAQGRPAGAAWVDAPLGWEVATAVPVLVVAHAADPAGVAEARLDVDGTTLATVQTGGASLEKAEFSWRPGVSGHYLLEVYGRSSRGEWGSPGTVEVRVDLGGPPSSTTTLPPTTTPVTTTTSTTTTTTTVATTTTTHAPPTTTTTTTTRPPTTTTSPPTTTTTTRPPATTTTTSTPPPCLGVPVPTGPTGTVTTDTVRLTWSYAGCEPEQFVIEIRDPDSALVDEGAAAGADRSWTTGTPTPACVTYYWRIRTYHLGDFGSWSSTGSFFVGGRSCP